MAARGDTVIGLDNLDGSLYPMAVKQRRLAALCHLPGFAFALADVLDAGALDALLAERPDAVVHLGGLAGVRPSIDAPALYMRVNVEGTATLLDRCRRRGVSRLVLASSSSVYGAHAAVPFRETSAAVERPASPYAASKRAAELTCAAFADLYGMGAIALRFFTVYGPSGRPDMAIDSFLRALLGDRALRLYGDGSSARDYTYVDDVVDGVMAAVERTREPGFATYNLGGARPVTLSDLVVRLERLVGRRARIERLPTQPGDVPRTAADLTLAARDLGFAPKIALDEGLARTLAAIRAEPYAPRSRPPQERPVP
jgi:UDP-glucuronate 4-epimerase